MWDKGGIGSDPDLLRVEAANLFVAYQGVDTARPGNRLGVIHFGGSSQLIVPLTLLDSAEQRQKVRAAIANPRRMAWTDPLEEEVRVTGTEAEPLIRTEQQRSISPLR